VKHGFTEHYTQYKWSSYNSIISDNPTLLNRDEVLSLFSGKEEFIDFHKRTNSLVSPEFSIET